MKNPDIHISTIINFIRNSWLLLMLPSQVHGTYFTTQYQVSDFAFLFLLPSLILVFIFFHIHFTSHYEYHSVIGIKYHEYYSGRNIPEIEAIIRK